MKEKKPILLVASAAALTLALSQGAFAGPVTDESPTAVVGPASQAGSTTEETQPAEPTDAEGGAAQSPASKTQAEPAAAAPPPPPAGLAAAMERMEKKHAEMMKERKRRYEDLRQRAAEVGLELPETPPWEEAGMEPPKMPTPPTPPSSMTSPWTSMSAEQRRAEWEKMRNMTAEDREAMREKRWQELRKRAKEQGVELPETPPWKQAEEQREAMKAKWEAYKKTVEGLTPEQKEAAQAIFGRGGRPMPPPMPMEAPCGGNYGGPGVPPGAMMPGYGGPGVPPDAMMPGYGGPGVPPGAMMPGHGAQGAGPSMYERGPAAPWYGGGKPSRQGPPPPSGSYNQPW